MKVGQAGSALLALMVTGPTSLVGQHIAEPLAGWVRVTGWLQPRYERSFDPGETRAFLRRARLDVGGQVPALPLTFRLQVDVLGSGRLRDAFLDYAIHHCFAVRIGQSSVPFGWRVSPRRDPFTERDVAASGFGSPSRDIGMLLHGDTPDRRLEYALGFMEGAGARVNARPGGGMLTSRVAWAVAGEIPDEETDPERSVAGNVAVGAGIQHAARNGLEDWTLARSTSGETRGNWTTLAIDFVAQRRGFAVVVKHYVRFVEPVDRSITPYGGHATALIAAVALVPGVEIVARRAWSRDDRRDLESRRGDWNVGLNLLHRAHALKTRFHYRAHSSGSHQNAHVVAAEFSLII